MCAVNSVLSVLTGEQSGDSGREVNIQDNGTSVLQTYLFGNLSHALSDETLNENQSVKFEDFHGTFCVCC